MFSCAARCSPLTSSHDHAHSLKFAPYNGAFLSSAMRLEILKMLETMRPMLQADGGDVQFVDYFNHIVYVKLTGACEGCPHANLTLQNGIEAKLVEKFPEIASVRDVSLEGMEL